MILLDERAQWFYVYVAAPQNAESAEARQGWRMISSTVIRQTPWFDVRQDSVRRPDGSPDTYEHVVSRGSVSVLAMDDSDRVAVTRQWIYTHGTRQWRLPGGGIDQTDRSPLEAAGRELSEETGVCAADWAQLGTVHCADSLSNHAEYAFRATALSMTGTRRLEPGEADLELHWLPFGRALELVTSGQVEHAGSAYAILMEALRRVAR
jgi:8-oxo-dGDP phosphatase